MPLFRYQAPLRAVATAVQVGAGLAFVSRGLIAPGGLAVRIVWVVAGMGVLFLIPVFFA